VTLSVECEVRGRSTTSFETVPPSTSCGRAPTAHPARVATVEFSDDNHVQTVVHERTDDGTTYKPSRKVTL
jgi:hypothetical protein